MRLFLYYVLCNVKNQIKKLFKTWVLVFIAVCMIFGFVVGMGASLIEDIAEDGTDSEITEEAPEDEIPVDEIPEISRETAIQLSELAVGGITLLVFVFNILSAGKSGSKIFNMTDVNLLFAAPLKPQSVLLFRLGNQILSLFLVAIYFSFQIPNLMINLGLGAIEIIAFFMVFAFVFVFAYLINIFLYTLSSTKMGVKKAVYPIGYGVLLVAAGGFAAYYKLSAVDPWQAATGFFNHPISRYIPVWGWIKGLAVSALEGRMIGFAIYALLLLVGAVVFAVVIWRLKADFYEDALKQSAETAELMEAAQNSGVIKRAKKDRGDKVKRDGLSRGSGASVIITKHFYNRFRFAIFRVFTKTSLTYLVTTVAICMIMRFVAHQSSILPVALVLGGMAFFRSLGNPINSEISANVFLMMPESAHKKMLFATLCGSIDCVLDLIPSFALACIVLGSDPLAAILWILFIVSVDFYSSSVGTFIDLSLSVGLAKNIRAVVQIMFVYFGLVPVIAIFAIGSVLGYFALAAAGAALFCVLIGAIFGSISPVFINNGRK